MTRPLEGAVWRVFLDANILFAAAYADGAVRRLLRDLRTAGHVLVADAYVVGEAERNVGSKAPEAARMALHELLLRNVEVAPSARFAGNPAVADWLPSNDRGVLLTAISLRCHVLMSGDKRHFTPGYGQTFGGVRALSPSQVLERLALQN